MPDFSQMRLGKLPATQDPRTLRLEPYLDLAALPPISAIIDWAKRVGGWPMFKNDILGCCVIAAMAHQEEAASAENGSELVISDADVLTGYKAVGGYVPGNPATDRGCDPLVALKWWRTVGIAGNQIGAFVSVNPANEQLVTAALYLFGGLFLGLELPVSAQDQIRTGQPWEVTSTSGDGAPGSWGGHMVYVAGRTAQGLYRDVTWGTEQLMTQRFIATYSPNEVFAVIPKAWLSSQGLAPSGFDLAALTRDLAIVSGQPDPGPPPQPTPWQPNATVASGLAWQQQTTAALTALYQQSGGNLARTRQAQQNLATYAGQLAAYFGAQGATVPELPEAGPQEAA